MNKYLDSGNHLSIKDRKSEGDIELKQADYEGKENVIIENIEDCNVHIPFIVKCIYLKQLKNVKIYASAVSGASFINSA